MTGQRETAMTVRFLRSWTLCLLLVASPGAARNAAAQNPGAQNPANLTWPDITLTRLDGAPAGSLVLSGDRHLVVVVRAACAPCDALLQQLALEAGAGHVAADRLTVILSGVGGAEAATLRARASGLPDAMWFVDATGETVRRLSAQTSPALFGLRRRSVVWTLRGDVLTDPRMKEVVLSWLR